MTSQPARAVRQLCIELHLNIELKIAKPFEMNQEEESKFKETLKSSKTSPCNYR